MTCSNEGREAVSKGLSVNSNKYPKHSVSWTEWNRGYRDESKRVKTPHATRLGTERIVIKCPRCECRHPCVVFKKIKGHRPFLYVEWGTCPKSNQPILYTGTEFE